MINKDYPHLLRRKFTSLENEGVTVEVAEGREAFEEMLEDKLSGSVATVKYVERENVGVDKVGKEIRINVTDTSKNDQKTNDEKYMDFPWDLDVQLGDQIFWDDTWWLVYHREHNSVQTHKTFTMKQCNFNYVLIFEGKVYEVPSYLINLTLYSDGMADKVYMSNADGKRKIITTENQYTKNAKIGQRLMLTNDTVFEITHIDKFTRPGVKDCIISQVFVTSKDDKENNLAYNENTIVKDESAIVGSNYIYLGSKEVYTIDDTKVDLSKVVNWEVQCESDIVKLDTSYNGCRVMCADDISYIGTVAKVILHTRSGDIIKEIQVKGMF